MYIYYVNVYWINSYQPKKWKPWFVDVFSQNIKSPKQILTFPKPNPKDSTFMDFGKDLDLDFGLGFVNKGHGTLF